MVRNHLGNIMDGVAKDICYSSPLVGQASAIAEGLKLASLKGRFDIIVESNVKNIISTF